MYSVVKLSLPKLGAAANMEVEPQSVVSALDGVEERTDVPLGVRRVRELLWVLGSKR